MNDGWGVTSNRIVITNQVNLFEFFFGNLMESISRFEYKKEIKEQNEELSRLNKELNGMVIRDRLTGLLNRQGMTEYIDEIIKEYSNVGEQQLFIIYCDLDKFKLCNDTYGHGAGDSVLKAFARILNESCGYEGKAVRYSGDEFLLILKDIGKDKVEVVINNIYKAIAYSDGFNEVISEETGEQIYIEEGNRVSVSIGVAGGECSMSVEKVRELIAKADKALYYVKENGKGKCCFYEDIVSAK